ncbi:MAG: circadian clock protein KaiC [Chloroflexi bacterium]|nr:MAG: circadian clock protein KaiC [Chloroflexota bacterium]
MTEVAGRPGDGLAKMPTGIDGFDEMTGGGLPLKRTSLVVGGAGSGKTIFALQTLVNGARQWGEPGIFVAFEELSHQIVENAASFGWDLPALQKDKLFFLDARTSPDMVTAGSFDLAGLLASLGAKAEEMKARRIVFDSVHVLLALLDDPIAERRELYRIHDWLVQGPITGIITSRTQQNQPHLPTNQEFLQYMADCVVYLEHRMVDLVSIRGLRVLKYRGSAFAENEAPLIIGQEGIEVASFAQPLQQLSVSRERVSTGVPRLDAMLDGGLYRGSSTLITGAPGTAKSTLSGALALAACERGERVLYVSFDEPAAQIVRNLASVNIHLQSYRDSGLLLLEWARAEAKSAEAHLLTLRSLMRQHEPQTLIVDPLSALVKAGGSLPALGVAQRLHYLTKRANITLLMTSLLEDRDPTRETSVLQISTVADNWIHLSYLEQGGERNRTLSIVKARGIGHSNQLRELILGNEGLDLAEVYSAGGEVLLGSLRWEKERAETLEKQQLRAELERRRHDVELAEAEAEARLKAVQRRVEARRAELAALMEAQEEQELAWRQYTEDLVQRRTGTDRHSGGSEGE